jgi:hypothetical protein
MKIILFLMLLAVNIAPQNAIWAISTYQTGNYITYEVRVEDINNSQFVLSIPTTAKIISYSSNNGTSWQHGSQVYYKFSNTSTLTLTVQVDNDDITLVTKIILVELPSNNQQNPIRLEEIVTVTLIHNFLYLPRIYK